MPDYVTMSDISGRLPAAFLIQALDDDNDGAADAGVWTQIAADVKGRIDGILGTKYAVPFENPLPAIVTEAARVFACEALYTRRGFATKENNPWLERADKIMAVLKDIATGKIQLTATSKRANRPAVIIAERAKTTPASGKTLV